MSDTAHGERYSSAGGVQYVELSLSVAWFVPRAALASRRAEARGGRSGSAGERSGIAVDGSSARRAVAATQLLAEAAEGRALPLRGRYSFVSGACCAASPTCWSFCFYWRALPRSRC